MMPARLTDTSPSLIATARVGPWRSASAAHTRIRAEVPSRLISIAPAIVTAGERP